MSKQKTRRSKTAKAKRKPAKAKAVPTPIPEKTTATSRDLLRELACFRKCEAKTRERIALYERDLEGYQRPGYSSDFVEPEHKERIPGWLEADRKRLASVQETIRTHEAKLAAMEVM